MMIRKARLSDAEGLARLYLQFWKAHRKADPLLRLRKKLSLAGEAEAAKKDLRKRNCTIFVALAQGRVVGFIDLLVKKNDPMFVVKEYGYVDSLVVDQRHRKKGIASALVLCGLSYLRGKGIRDVKLNLYCSNRIAMAVWRKLGFREISKNMIRKI